MHKVSILVACYNGAAWAASALQSIGHQTYPHWEVLFVEDGSPQPSAHIVSAFAAQFPSKVKYIVHEHNQGLPASRNSGLRQATGDLVAILDVDDLWEPNHLETLVCVHDQYPKHIVFCAALMFGSRCDWWGPSMQEAADIPQAVLLRNFITPSGVLLPRHIFERIGMFSPNVKGGVDDLDFWCRALRYAIPFHFVPSIVFRYRQSPNNMSAKQSHMQECAWQVIKEHLRAVKLPREHEIRMRHWLKCLKFSYSSGYRIRTTRLAFSIPLLSAVSQTIRILSLSWQLCIRSPFWLAHRACFASLRSVLSCKPIVVLHATEASIPTVKQLRILHYTPIIIGTKKECHKFGGVAIRLYSSKLELKPIPTIPDSLRSSISVL